MGPGDFAFDVSLKGGHSIHGTLVWPNGQPREDKTSKVGVALRREPLPSSRIVKSTRTRPDDTFSLYSVDPGSYYVTCGSKEAFRYVAVSLPEGDPTAFDVVLQVAE